ncbi:hypothetical protein JXQ70_17450 [bacterium]|nr:hypothetical protein [bacterium]
MLDELIFKKSSPPYWFNEGLATYFEGSKINSRGEMMFGVIDHAKISVPDSKKYFHSSGWNRLSTLRKNK